MIDINFTKIYLTEECSSLNRPFLLFVFYPIRHSNMAREAVGKKKKKLLNHTGVSIFKHRLHTKQGNRRKQALLIMHAQLKMSKYTQSFKFFIK